MPSKMDRRIAERLSDSSPSVFEADRRIGPAGVSFARWGIAEISHRRADILDHQDRQRQHRRILFPPGGV